MSESQKDVVELESSPTEILEGLTVALVETGRKYTVSTDRLEDEGDLVVEKGVEDDVTLSPAALLERLDVGIYYLPEYSPAWEVDEALSRLEGRDE